MLYVLASITTLVALALLPTTALAATYAVPGDFSTIGAAIANASAGDTITVNSGTYYENLRVDRGITLIGKDTGAGLPTIYTSGTGIDISADNAIVQGFRVTIAGTGISVHDCGNALVTDCTVVGNNNGIILTGTHGCTIMNNTITANHNVGIYVVDSGGNAVYLNKVTGNQFGISITGSSSSNTLYMNTLADNSGANGLANGKYNSWNSSIPLTYGYGGRQFSGSLGNYWGNLKGQDNDRNGVLDTSVMLAESNGDYDPLAEPPLDRPAADFTSDAASGTAPLPVQFNDNTRGYPVSWRWDFGDGNTSDMQNPPHIYKATGSYTVSLLVKNVHGEDRLIRSNYVVVSTPTAVPSATPVPPTATPEPWPTVTPTAVPVKTSTPAPSATPKPTPALDWLAAIAAIGLASMAWARKNE
jgi:parallel beta-helix repeat protein